MSELAKERRSDRRERPARRQRENQRRLPGRASVGWPIRAVGATEADKEPTRRWLRPATRDCVHSSPQSSPPPRDRRQSAISPECDPQIGPRRRWPPLRFLARPHLNGALFALAGISGDGFPCRKAEKKSTPRSIRKPCGRTALRRWTGSVYSKKNVNLRVVSGRKS